MPKSTLIRIARWIAAAELPVIVLISPALLFPTPKRLAALALVPNIWICAKITTGRFLPRTPLNFALYLMLLMVGVSLYATFDVTFSLGKVAGLLLGLLVYWASVRWVETKERLAMGTAAFVAAGAGLAVIGLLGTNWMEKFPVLGAVIARLPRVIRGLPGAEEGFQPNAVAGCLVMFVPLQVALSWRLFVDSRTAAPGTRFRTRLAFVISMSLLALTGGTLLLTQSRGAWIGMAMAGLAFCVWYGRQTRWVAAAILAAVLIAGIAIGPERLATMAVNQAGPGMAGNVEGRLELWSQALDGIQDFPITGMGMNTFRKAMPPLYPVSIPSPDLDVAHAHNHLLQVALDLGIPGLIAYIALWGLLVVMLVQVYRSSTDPWTRATAGGIGAGLMAHFTFGMTDAIPLGAKVGVLFWLAVALVTACAARIRASA